MKYPTLALTAALAARQVAAHATFQALYVDGTDFINQCVRAPTSNNPVTDVSSNDVRCNINSGAVANKCPAKAGSTVTIEMHQQPNERNCNSEAIGGAHYGPVMAYMSKVSDSSTADGSSGWFKVFEDTWAKNPSGGSGDDDFWGTNDLNTCCGLMDVKIPDDLAPGDYLLRAEAIALHTAGSSGGAQFYMSCYQLTVTGSGSAEPSTVTFPGAYSASDPGILVNIHAALSEYIAPGPEVYAGGSTKVAGSDCTGCEATCTVGAVGPGGDDDPPPTGGDDDDDDPPPTGGDDDDDDPPPTGGDDDDPPSSCTAAMYEQCGGEGFTGCTTCESGSTCQDISPPYYSQCL